jgi:hypothetical protein
LRLQGVDDEGGAHVDLEVDDVQGAMAHAIGLGATHVLAEDADLVVLRSPAGLGFCLTRWAGARTRPDVVHHSGGPVSRVDQVCLDIPPAAFDREMEFWAALTGWRRGHSSRPEFSLLLPPTGGPVRLLLQRLDEGERASAHVDVACSDRGAVTAIHHEWGSRDVRPGPFWNVLRDPAGGLYCLTDRHPETGRLR